MILISHVELKFNSEPEGSENTFTATLQHCDVAPDICIFGTIQGDSYSLPGAVRQLAIAIEMAEAANLLG